MLPQMLSKINVTSENIPLNPLPLQKEGEARHRHVRLAKKATAMITVNFLQKGQEYFCVTQLDFFLMSFSPIILVLINLQVVDLLPLFLVFMLVPHTVL